METSTSFRSNESRWDDPDVLESNTDVFWSIRSDDYRSDAPTLCRDCFEAEAEPDELLCAMCKFDHERNMLR